MSELHVSHDLLTQAYNHPRHLAHWTVWNKWKLYDRSIGVYDRFLPSSYDRAKHQGYQGARIGKMQDDNPNGWSAPGEINSLLIWQQPHLVSRILSGDSQRRTGSV